MSSRSFASGKIDSAGMLHLSRIANQKQMCCPYGETHCHNSTVTYSYCGDYCPHFSEVEKTKANSVLNLCHETILYIKEFTDERT